MSLEISHLINHVTVDCTIIKSFRGLGVAILSGCFPVLPDMLFRQLVYSRLIELGARGHAVLVVLGTSTACPRAPQIQSTVTRLSSAAKLTKQHIREHQETP